MEFLVAPLLSHPHCVRASWQRGLRGGGREPVWEGFQIQGGGGGISPPPEELLFGSSLCYPHLRPRWDGTYGFCAPGRAAAESAPLLLARQVWFQNRRMKDKRQRLAMTWPHPADPAFYTYMMSHAAAAGGLPYPFPSHLPLPYYSPVGLGAASAASAAASPFSGPLRPLDTFRVLSQPYPRPELLCAFRHPPLYPGPAHGLGTAAGGPCSCLACHGGPANGLAPRAAAAAAAASDFTCASTSRSDSFLTFAPSVLSKASSVALDQREEVPLTR